MGIVRLFDFFVKRLEEVGGRPFKKTGQTILSFHSYFYLAKASNTLVSKCQNERLDPSFCCAIFKSVKSGVLIAWGACCIWELRVDGVSVFGSESS